MEFQLIDMESLLIKLSAVLGASFLIERCLVLMNEMINKLFVIQASTRYSKIDRINNQLAEDRRASKEDEFLNDAEVTDDDPREIIPFPGSTHISSIADSHFDVLLIKMPAEVESPGERFKVLRKINNVRKDFWMQTIGTFVAIVVCYYSNFSIWLFDMPVGAASDEPGLWGAVFTGIIIGGGSKPINFLMQFLVNRKVELRHEEVRETVSNEKISDSKEATSKSTIITPKALSMEDYLGFSYRGGDRPERLENTHLFRKKVDLIVYHHTAMHSDAPYDALVKEFDRKGWLTGYNCVVFKDGTIRALCRWDRFGNHALPHNTHSLGIAMQGNFETNPDVPFSNHDGRFGLIAPTSEQIDSTARVTALWVLLHGIELSFPDKAPNPVRGIIPHCLIARKACPGNNFPYAAFENKVRYYTHTWENDSAFDLALQQFKQIPFVLPKKTTE